MKIVIIGSGNIAAVFGKLLKKAGHEIVQIVGRNKNAVEILANKINAPAETNLQNIFSKADLYIIAVSDHSIEEIANKISFHDKLVVHTAGSVPINVLQNISSNYGVLYPLQSLKKEINHLPEIPLLVDGNNETVKNNLVDFAKTISANVSFADDEMRLKFHAAAVVVSNFTNHLFVLAKNFCENENIDFNILFPLIKETVLRIEKNNPAEMQTGPAIRKDENTIKKHLELLHNDIYLKKIYELMSKSIKNYYK